MTTSAHVCAYAFAGGTQERKVLVVEAFNNTDAENRRIETNIEARGGGMTIIMIIIIMII